MNIDHILKALILFYNNPQDVLLKKHNQFKIASEIFERDVEYYLNIKIGVDRIYHSLINASNSYLLIKNNLIHISGKSKKNTEKIQMTANEPFFQLLTINLCKLQELLERNRRKFHEDDDINFDYLGKLIKRIEHSKIREIRNNWLAHPFEYEDNGLVFKSKHIKSSMLSSLGKICTKEDFPIYDQSNDRLKWFCERYLMKSNITKENDQLTFRTSAMDIIKELYKLSNSIKIKKLYNIEPFFIVPEDQIHEFHLSPSRYIEHYNYKKFI